MFLDRVTPHWRVSPAFASLFASTSTARFTALPVLLVGFVWFSLIDVTNALWAVLGRLVCGPVLPDRHSVSAPGISLASILEC